MSNMISNNNSNSNGSTNNIATTYNNIRNVCNFLQPVNPAALPPGSCPYDHIIELIRGLDLQDDGIMMNHKIKSIETDFCNIVRDENMLCESMEYINDKALGDGETALKFALLFSSRNFDVLAMKETKVRSAMLKILETNFLNADQYRVQDKERLYNSITLLGEYYHRVRLADNSPITILGESLLGLLLREINELELIDVKLAKLILSQITLNGDMMRVKHKTELTQLLYHIRRNLIEQPVLKPAVKALLLMTLDLYYSNFANLGPQLEEMYTKYLVQEDEDEGNNNLEVQLQQQPQLTYQQPLPQQISFAQEPNAQPHNSSFENGENVKNDSFEVQPTAKKWSEQVCEDSFFDDELNVSGGASSAGNQERLSYSEQRDQLHSSSSRNDTEHDSAIRNSRRSYQPAHSPRPLKQNYNSNESNDTHQQQTQSQQSGGEERDETKPLPRWRAPRFNRDPNDQPEGRQRNHQRRYSASFDEDGQSIRSEGGSIRLYSINDRLKREQEKLSGGNNYNSIANSNWDRQSQRDDRSERSYMSNYERGNRGRGNGRHYNNRQTYDKPPRFQKNQQMQQQHHNNHHHNQNKDNKNHGDTWRRSHDNTNNSYQDENSSYHTNGPESNSRSSSRARTLPRPAKANLDGSTGNTTPTYGSNQSPTHNQYQRGGGQTTRPRNYNARYSSQSSLASDASSTLDRRQHHHQRNRNFVRRPQQPHQQRDWEDTHSMHGQPEEASWDLKDNNSELVRNARQTTKYMNYLSQK